LLVAGYWLLPAYAYAPAGKVTGLSTEACLLKILAKIETARFAKSGVIRLTNLFKSRIIGGLHI
jgi:hypothetical protein